MSDVSKTECYVCCELIRYGQEVDSIEVFDSRNDLVDEIAHADCASDYRRTYDPDRICSWPCEHCGEDDPDDWEDE